MLYNHICDWRYQEMKRNIIFPWLLPRFVSIRCCLHVFSHTSSHTNKVFPRLVPWFFLKKFFTWLTPRSLTYTLFFPWFFPKFLTSAIKFPRFPPENLHSSVPNFQPKQKRPVIEASGWNKSLLYTLYSWYKLRRVLQDAFQHLLVLNWGEVGSNCCGCLNPLRTTSPLA